MTCPDLSRDFSRAIRKFFFPLGDAITVILKKQNLKIFHRKKPVKSITPGIRGMPLRMQWYRFYDWIEMQSLCVQEPHGVIIGRWLVQRPDKISFPHGWWDTSKKNENLKTYHWKKEKEKFAMVWCVRNPAWRRHFQWLPFSRPGRNVHAIWLDGSPRLIWSLSVLPDRTFPGHS